MADVDVDAVYVCFRLANDGNVFDRIVDAVTGGPEVHCEFVFYAQKQAEGQKCLLTVASVDPRGVYASSIGNDPFYGVCDTSGAFLPIDIKKPFLEWVWLDVTTLFRKSAFSRREAMHWCLRRVGTAQYRKETYYTYVLPCGRNNIVSEDQGVDVKDRYICSEFIADALLGFAHLTGLQRNKIEAACRRALGSIDFQTQKLSPHDLYETLRSFTGVEQLDSQKIRLLVRAVYSTETFGGAATK